MTARVTRLSTTAVKGMRLASVDSLLLEAGGVAADRRFYVIDARDRMVNGKQLGCLTAVVPDYDPEHGRLTLRFPDRSVVTGLVEPGPLVQTSFFSQSLRAMLVTGPWAAALSQFAGRPLRLVEAGPRRPGVDRGKDGAVTLISRASLQRFAQEAGKTDVDARRFRMLIEIDGVAAHAEDDWVGCELRAGEARLRLRGHVGRCLVTSRDPDSGEVDLPTLDVLGSYRHGQDTTEPLAFGIYGSVTEPGRISVGDPVEPLVAT